MNMKVNSRKTWMTIGMFAALCQAVTFANAQEAADRAANAYTLGPDDAIRIIVEDHPEWSGDFTVKPEGTIMLRDVGEITVSGQTRDELKATLANLLGRFITNPRITIDMLQYRSQVIYVLGEVNRPGEYSTAGKTITVRDAVIMAGLPAPFAATNRVFVITPHPRRPREQVVNLARILERGETMNNIIVQPGDIVYVPNTLLGKLNDFFSAIFSPINTYRATTGL
jgi:Periplasmic protein involved in polysaccharide export